MEVIGWYEIFEKPIILSDLNGFVIITAHFFVVILAIPSQKSHH